MQLLMRGAMAGVTGGVIGATLSSLNFGTGAYAPLGYLFWLLITAILGMMFTLIIGALQKFGLHLSLLPRTIGGGLIGMMTAGLWAVVIIKGFSSSLDWFGNGIVCMMVGTGIVAGILGGLLNRQV